MSIRQQIIDNIITRLRTITISNGYTHNLGQSVFAWRMTDFQPAELPALNLRDENSEITDGPIGLHTYRQAIVIDAFASGSDAVDQVRLLAGDIIKCLGADPYCSGLALDTLLISDQLMAAHQDEFFAKISLTFQVIYRTRNFDPFNQ